MRVVEVVVSLAVELLAQVERVVAVTAVKQPQSLVQQILVVEVAAVVLLAVQALLLLDTQSDNLMCVGNAKSLSAEVFLI
jgi:uncharacterized membrane protein